MGCAIGMSVAAACEIIYWLTLKPVAKLMVYYNMALTPRGTRLFKKTFLIVFLSLNIFILYQFRNVYFTFISRHYDINTVTDSTDISTVDPIRIDATTIKSDPNTMDATSATTFNCNPDGDCNGDFEFCSSSYPCGEGQGDCDSDADCNAGLKCSDNCPSLLGFDPAVDCCIPHIVSKVGKEKREN